MTSSGDRIKALRVGKNLTQDELAENLGCSKQSIYRYENDQSKMDTHTLIQTADFFEVSADYLLGISNKKDSEDDAYNDYYPTFYDEDYFWIYEDRNGFGGHTQWFDFLEDGRELRTLRPIIPEKTLKLCKELHGSSPLIINTIYDVRTFINSGGNAFIRESICKRYLPRFMKPIIVN